MKWIKALPRWGRLFLFEEAEMKPQPLSIEELVAHAACAFDLAQSAEHRLEELRRRTDGRTDDAHLLQALIRFASTYESDRNRALAKTLKDTEADRDDLEARLERAGFDPGGTY